MKSYFAVALLLATLFGVSGAGLCCTSMAQAEAAAKPHDCCPPEAGFTDARVSCCESPSTTRATLSDVFVASSQATLAHPAAPLASAGAPGAPPLVRVVGSWTASPPASSPILRI